MSETAAEASETAPEIRRLTFDLDVEVCVIGGGLAGLSVALEAAKMGASVALLEARHLGWAASGHHLGTVRPGFDVAAQTIVARIGRRSAAELWRMSQTGAEIVRVQASAMPALAMSDGALDVATNASGERLLDDQQALGSDFGLHCERWDKDRVRDKLDSGHYFAGLHHPRAFQLDGAAYLRGLAALARQAGVRIFEQTPVTAMDAAGARKRITTPLALLRASHVVLAGNVHLGSVLPRLTATLLPVWRTGGTTAPLGDRLKGVIDFAGSVADTDGIDRFRVLDDGRLMWSRREATWQGRTEGGASGLRRRIARVFPSLGKVEIAATFGGAIGQTVHGMPQIGQLRPGLWIAAGFGRQGLNTTAMAGRVIAQAILVKDDRWRLFAPFDLIWAGGRTGRVAGYAIEQASRGRAAVASAWARRQEASANRAEVRQARIAAAAARTLPSRPPAPTQTPVSSGLPNGNAVQDAMPPSPFMEMPGPAADRSQESEQPAKASA